MGLVDTAFVKQFKDTIMLLVQQKQSKLRVTTIIDTDFVGEAKFTDQLGPTEMVEKTARHQDTPIIDPDHQRRRITPRDFIHNTLFDKEDQLRMIVDPKSSYATTASRAAGRKMDDRIIAALGGSSSAGKEGGTAVPLPDAQKIVVAAAGMNKTKVLRAQRLLDDKDVEEENRFMVVKPEQIENLLGTVEVASSDFNTVKALVDGQIDTWVGFKWIKSTRLVTDAADSRLCYAYQQEAIQLGIQREPTIRIDERPDKNYAWQVWLGLSIGTTRLEEERVVEIACLEV